LKLLSEFSKVKTEQRATLMYGVPELFELDKEWKQSNISVNPKKFTLRGLHYQSGETAQAKLIKVINGRILDFVMDLRIPLRTYNNCQFFDMMTSITVIRNRCHELFCG
jgi:dTDP-4-dehydrorhamnose 3,5-epimerase-like enzyme